MQPNIITTFGGSVIAANPKSVNTPADPGFTDKGARVLNRPVSLHADRNKAIIYFPMPLMV